MDGQQPAAPALLQARTRAELVREITEEATRFGFLSLADAVRQVMTIFARSERVRDAVRRDFALGLGSKSGER